MLAGIFLLVLLLAPGVAAPAAAGSGLALPPGLVAFLDALRRSGTGFLLLAAALMLAGPLAGTLSVALARVAPDPAALARRGRIGQAVLVGIPVLAAAASAWFGRPVASSLPAAPADAAWTASGATAGAYGHATAAALGAAEAVAGVAVVAAFGLLVAERVLAGLAEPGRASPDGATRPAVLPEAAGLRRLALAAMLAAFLAGIADLAPAVGVPWGARVVEVLDGGLALVSLELAARAGLLLWLPPPRPEAARGGADSLLARILAVAVRAEPAGRTIRAELGLDFSRSWALGYMRRASLPLLGALALIAWGMSGVVLVPVDGRAVYERFGAPVAVLHPGIHLILPWPLGVGRHVEYGTLHEVALGDTPPSTHRSTAEEAFPTEADRLWDQPHPGELNLVIASVANTAGGPGAPDAAHRQLFQSVSADLRVLWRVGLTDRDAIRATYATEDPASLLRASASEVVADAFAGRTLDALLGANVATMGAELRRRLQADLDRHATGLQAVAFIVEAIHPPAGAADAYHAVRAAEINASAQIFAERGRAITVRAQSREFEFEHVASATARAAEIDGAADIAALRYTADARAAEASRKDFLFERYLAALTASLAHAPITIIDSRLFDAAPTIDLRPFPGAAPTTSDGE